MKVHKKGGWAKRLGEKGWMDDKELFCEFLSSFLNANEGRRESRRGSWSAWRRTDEGG